MATEKITLGIDVVSNTEAEVVKAVKLKKAFEDVQKAAGSIGGTAGSRAVYSKAAPVSSGNSGGLNSQEYGTAQAATGMGSSARDFAKEAQGLGGLVRVYATFAANLFAVSAAFSALRSAAATENIVKGLDQLGAASGRSLGTLSKQLASASDGAISLRDSMTAVAQASSGGLNNKQILELGDIAKKASETLGLSMPDALSRLSRGVTKIEPELLDELGIFVKVDEASQKYALSLGKTVSSLSDFEKRQGFANAVLQQGKEKFAAIEGAANPFDKLLAAASDLATAGLMLVNKFFGPIANFLSESPVALALVFASIATILLKQAIPALGQFRKGLQAGAEEALKAAEVFKSSFGDKFQSTLEARFKIPDLSADISKMEKDLAKVKVPAGLAKTDSLNKLSAASEADPATLRSVNKALELRNDIISSGKKGSKDATEQQIANAKSERDVIQKTIALYQKKIDLTVAQTSLQTEADKQSRFHPETIALEKYTKLRATVDKATAVSNAAQNAGIVGISQSWKILNQEIEEKGIKGFDKFTTQARGGVAAITERLSGLVGKLGIVGEVIGAVIAVYSIFDATMSKATKQQETLNTKIEESASSVKTVNDVFTLYTEKKKNAFGIEGIAAFTTALAQVSVSFDAQLDALLEFRKAAGIWDEIKDDIAGVFGKSNTDNIKKNAADSVKAILKSLEFSSGGDAAKTGIAGILNLKPEQLNDIDALKKATKELDEVGLGKLAKEFKTIEEREQFSTNAAKAFMESLAGINKLVDQLIQSNAFTDLQGKLGVELVIASERLAQALNDPLKALTDIAAIGKDPKMLAIIGKEDLTYLVQAGKLITDINTAQEERAAQGAKLKKTQDLSNIISTVSIMEGTGPDTVSEAAKAAEIAAAEAYSKADENLKNLKKKAVEFAGQGVDLVTKISDEGFKRISLGLKLAQEQAALTVQSAKLGYAAQAGLDTSKQEADVKRAEINIQERLIKASYDAEIATIENTKILQRLTATQEVLAAEALRAKAGTPEEKAANAKLADTMSESAKKTMSRIDAQAAIKGSDPRARASAMRTYGEDAVKLAQAANKSEQIPALKLQGALAQTAAQKQIVDINEANKQQEYTFKLKQSQLGLEKERLTLQAEELNNSAQLNSYITPSLAYEKEVTSLATLKSDIDTKASIIARERVLIEQNSSVVSKETYEDQKALNNKKTENLTLEEKTKKFAVEINTIKEKGAGIQAKLVQESAIELEKQKLKNSIEESRLSNLQAELGFKQQLGLIDEKTANSQKAQYDTQLLKLKATEEEARIRADIASKNAALATAEEALTKAKGTNNETAISLATISQTAAQTALDLSNQQLSTLTQRTALQQTAIDQAKTYNDRLIEQKQHLEDLVSLTTSLGAVFGNVGTNIGDAVGAADALLKTQKDRKEALSATNLTEKQRADIKTKFDKQEFSNSTALLGQTKKLFSEQSTGYKLLGATEKAMHAWRIASMVKEGAVKAQEALTAMGITSMADAAAAVQKIPAVLMSFVETMGWPGVAAGAAFVASLGLSGGGGGGTQVDMTGLTSADRQKTQGTGDVFGDSEAKSTSIVDSLEIMKKNSILGLNYDNRMLKALQNLSDSIGNAAMSLYSVQGLRSGSNFGTMPSKSSTPGFGADIPIIGGLLSGIFGGGTTTSSSVTSAGIQFIGSFRDLTNDVAGSVIQYKDVLTQFHEDGGWFGSDSDWSTLQRQQQAISASVQSSIGDIFRNAESLFITVGAKLGKTAESVVNILAGLDAGMVVDIMGLTGQALIDELNGVIGSKLSYAASVIFSDFTKYKNFGEDYLATVLRVLDANDKVSQSLASMGKSSTALSYDISEYLVKAAGGLENFMSQAEFFASNFITEAQRVIPVQASVAKQMGFLGISTSLTKAQFAKLVLAQDLSTKSGADFYQSLMDLAPGFNSVIEAITNSLADTKSELKNTVSSFSDFAKNIKTFRESLVLSASSTATPLEKYSQAKTQFESTYALALSGDKDAMSKVTSSAQTVLDLGKTLYASSDEYSRLFNYISEKLGYAEISAQSSVDVAQLQLTALDSQVNILTKIEQNTASMAGVSAYATGGLASKGWALVGERGPEMVNFSNPAQVYTADQTAGMFAQGNGMAPAINTMVTEIQQLRQEIIQLRKDQQTQTGDIIISNYDAHQKSSDEIATAVVESSQDISWATRSKSEIK